MATTEVELANQALGTISARGRIVTLNERSEEAETVNLYFNDTRDALLRAAPWNFARRVDYLSLFRAAPGTPENPSPGDGYWHPDQPPPGFLYDYYYPADCVKFRAVIPQINSGSGLTPPLFSVPSWTTVPLANTPVVRFLVGTAFNDAEQEITVISTNQRLAVGVWIRRVTNVSLWDPSFKQAFIDALACRIAMPITGNKDVANRCEQLAKGVMGTITAARVADGNEGTTRDDHIPDWLVARGVAQQAGYGVAGAFWETPTWLAV